MTLARYVLTLSFAVLHSACATPHLPLATMPGSNATAAQHNSKGIVQYEMGYWSVARDHFVSAIEADPNLAEPHFNLALTLDKLDLHFEATTHFKKAAELAPDTNVITQAQSRAYNHVVSPPLVHETDKYGTSSYGRIGADYLW